jgi:hypothetical protein
MYRQLTVAKQGAQASPIDIAGKVSRNVKCTGKMDTCKICRQFRAAEQEIRVEQVD